MHTPLVTFTQLIVANMSDFAQSKVAARIVSPSISPHCFTDGASALFSSGSQSPRRCRSPVRGGLSLQEQLDKILAREELILDLLRSDRPGAASNGPLLASVRVEHRQERELGLRPDASSQNGAKENVLRNNCEASGNGNCVGESLLFAGGGKVLVESNTGLFHQSDNTSKLGTNVLLKADKRTGDRDSASRSMTPTAAVDAAEALEMLDKDTLNALKLADKQLGWSCTNDRANGEGSGGGCGNRAGRGSTGSGDAEIIYQEKEEAACISVSPNTPITWPALTSPGHRVPADPGKFSGWACSIPPGAAAPWRRPERGQYSSRSGCKLPFKAYDGLSAHREHDRMESDGTGASEPEQTQATGRPELGQDNMTACEAEAAEFALGLSGGDGLLKVLRYSESTSDQSSVSCPKVCCPLECLPPLPQPAEITRVIIHLLIVMSASTHTEACEQTAPGKQWITGRSTHLL